MLLEETAFGSALVDAALGPELLEESTHMKTAVATCTER